MPDGPNQPVRTRGHKKKARTRSQLVSAAVEVIAERGEAFTVSDVADRAGVANGTFYNYFADRDALVAAIVPEVIGSFAARNAVEVGEDDPAVRFASITAAALTGAMADPGQMRVVLRLEAAQHEVLRGEPVRHLRDDIAAGQATGRFVVDPGDAVIDVVVGSILTATRRIVDGVDAGLVDEAYPSEVIEILLRSLGIVDAEARSIADDAVTSARTRLTG